jgi:hypothetical protein
MRYCACGFAAFLLAASACSGNNPASPSSSSIAAPLPLVPTNDAQVVNSAQPMTLVVQNAAGVPAGATYDFEVATDSAFVNNVQAKTGVAAGTSGQTGVTLGMLAAGADYYWQARAKVDGTAGVFSTVFKFTIGASIAINAPVSISPANGASVSTQPTLTVINATPTGPSGPIAYRFDISTAPTFAALTVTGSVAPGAGQTSFTPTTDLAPVTTFYWRAIAIDQTDLVTSPASAARSFTTMTAATQASALAAQEGLTLWPNLQPPGTPGHAVLGDNWQVQSLTGFTGVQFLSPALDALRVFDLLDRGMDPQSALNWCNSNGYPNSGAYYPSADVVGFPQEYMALIGGQWSMIIKVGA